jgi:beta-glucosidase
MAVQALRAAAARPVQVGIALNLSPAHPASTAEADQQAAQRYDGFSNRMVLDPLFRSHYPEDIFTVAGGFFGDIQPEDLEIISTPIDFTGVNYYTRDIVAHDETIPFMESRPVQPPNSEYSQMWEIYPQGIYEILVRLWKEYGRQNLFITENGVPVPDGFDFDGKVRDVRRVRYLRDHLLQVHRAIREGAPVRGYFVWSLLDNFEWALGYRTRFGIVYVEFETGKRTLKQSAEWYRDIIQANGFDPARSIC